MKYLYIHQYFTLPIEAGGTRSYYLAKKLVEQGNTVILLTSLRHKNKCPLIQRKTIEGISVVYINNFYETSLKKYSRIRSYLRFMIIALVLAIKEKNIDVIYASSTPLTVGIPALIVKTINRNVKFVFEVRDLWPDVPYEMGIIKSKTIYKIVKRFEHLFYDKADKIIAISEGIKIKLPKKYSNKVSVHSFGSNVNVFFNNKNNKWKEGKNINSETLYVYTGAIGKANGMDYLINAAMYIENNNHKNIFIAMVGEGSEEEYVLRRIKEYGLQNIALYKPVPIVDLNRVYESADAGIILFGGKSKTYRFTASPNKFFDYIAAGLPVFFNFSGPLKESIQKEKIGFYMNYMNYEDLAEKMIYYAYNKNELIKMSKKARLLAETIYNRDMILGDLVKELDSMFD